MNNKLFVFLFFVTILFMACSHVKPYQKAYLNDENMELGFQNIQNYEVYSESIREGASGGNGSKGGGGCGCN